MSDTLTATGKCAEISERGDWTTFHIDVGRQYPVKLSTKLAPLVELGRAASKDGGAFDWTYTETEGGDNPHKPGTKYTNRYLQGVEAAGSVATPGAPVQVADAQGNIRTENIGAHKSSDGMSKDEWARKDSAIHKMACIKTAAAALTHTMPADPTPEDMGKFINRVKFLSREWHTQVEAVRNGDESDIPFSPYVTQEDADAIPY